MKRILLLGFLLAIGSPRLAMASSVVLTWGASTTSGVTYNVYKAPAVLGGGVGVTCPIAPGSPFVQVASGITVLTYADSTVTIGNGYCYFVTAALGSVESLPSNIVTTVILPAPPSGLVGTVAP